MKIRGTFNHLVDHISASILTGTHAGKKLRRKQEVLAVERHSEKTLNIFCHMKLNYFADTNILSLIQGPPLKKSGIPAHEHKLFGICISIASLSCHTKCQHSAKNVVAQDPK